MNRSIANRQSAIGNAAAPLRRAYFALVKSLGLDEAARHAFNFGLTGKESTREFSQADWRDAVAELQRLSGREGVEPGRPHLRSCRIVGGTSLSRATNPDSRGAEAPPTMTALTAES